MVQLVRVCAETKGLHTGDPFYVLSRDILGQDPRLPFPILLLTGG